MYRIQRMEQKRIRQVDEEFRLGERQAGPRLQVARFWKMVRARSEGRRLGNASRVN